MLMQVMRRMLLLHAAVAAYAANPASRRPPQSMAAHFYTTRDLQEILHVDRTTIYRMADSGRLPAVKVGSQWRFPRRAVDQWLARQIGAPAPATDMPPAGDSHPTDLSLALPIECVQLMQDSFADALGVTIVISDLDGRPVTRPSNPCGFLGAIEAEPQAYTHCLQWWADLAHRLNLQPEFVPSPMGLLCARAFFRSGSQLRGMVIFGGIAPKAWPPGQSQIEQIAATLGMEPDQLAAHERDVFHADAARQQHLLGFAQRIADIVTHLLSHRQQPRAEPTLLAPYTGI